MPDNPILTAAVWIVPLIIAIVFHEVSHGWVARWLGDPTAAERRRLTFNPIRHIDPFGTVILPLFLAIAHLPVFGWAKPVPVDARRLRNPRLGMMLVALAGPGMNLLLAGVGALGLGLLAGSLPESGPATPLSALAVQVLLAFLFINIFLAIFNLIPLPPFDGGHIVEGLLPRPAARGYAKLGRFAFPLLIILLLVLPMIAPGADVVVRWVQPVANRIAEFYLGLAQAIA